MLFALQLLSIVADAQNVSTRNIYMQGGDLYNNGNVKRITSSREEFLRYLNSPVFLNALEIKDVKNIEEGETISFYCYTDDFTFIGTTAKYNLLEGTVWVKIKLENEHSYTGTKELTVTYVTNGFPDTKNTYTSLSRLSFCYEVFDEIGETEPSNTGNERHFDNGMLILPPNYSNTGEPVRLVIFAHGSGGFSWTSSGSYKDLLEFVASNGYAVCDCCGMSDKYSIGELAPPISDARHNLMSISCYCSMYEFLMKNFNLKDDGCFMFGKSNGGIATTYISQAQPIPIIASAALAPSISIIESLRYTRGGSLQYWTDRLGLNVDCSNVEKNTHFYKVESSNQDIVNYLKSHANVFAHIDPFVMQTDIDANELATAFFSKPYLEADKNVEVSKIISNSKNEQTCPMMIFHALDDRAVPYEITKWYVEMCKKADSPCFLRTIPSGFGGHHAVDTDEKAPKVTFTTKFGETVQIVETYAELVEWFNMFNSQNSEVYKFKLVYYVDGEFYKSMDVAYGTTITPEVEPAKEGYTFSGWSEIPKKMPPMDVAVTGNFTANKYKLIYMVDGANYKTSDIEYGTAITLEETPTKEGYTFSGWNEIPTTMPAKDVTITGTFSINKYKLIYKVDGADYKIYEIEYGATITVDATPIKEGYSFSGWSDIPATMPANDVTVTGTFVANKYKLVYQVDGADYKSSDVEYGAAITPEANPTKVGHTFSGWGTIPATMPAHDVYVNGTFSKGNYKLTYKVDGVDYKTISYDYGSPVTPEAAPIKEGYSFSGWSDIPATMPANDVTVTGTFVANKYKLIYQVNGADYKSYEVEYGAAITPEAAPTKEGYSFSGWSDIPSTMPAKDVTITGTFSINKYKLIYQVDGADYRTYEVEYGATITVDATPIKEGYSFSGWSDIPATMPANDVTVTGTFVANKYKLIYQVNGADYKSYEVEYGAAITPEAAPTKEGYSFSGWSDIPSTMPAKDVTITGSFTQVDYEIEGIKYEVSGNDVSIIEADDTSGDVKISSTVVINDKTYTVTSIANGAFKNNTKMTSVTIPNSVTSIGDNAFNGCSKLSEISIGSAVTTIGSKAFANIKPVATTRGDDGLKISCYALSVPTTAADAFDNTPIGNATLLVDDNFVSSYKSTAPWSGFGTIMGFNEATGIKSIRIDSQNAIIYDMRGNRIDQPQRGVNIIRMNDGTTRKVVVGSER